MLPLLFVLAFYVIVYVYSWQVGALPLAAMAGLWIAWRAPTTSPTKQAPYLHWLLLLGLACFFAVNTLWTARTVEMDYFQPYSGSKDAAEFLRSVGANADSTCGYDFLNVAVQAYFPRGVFMNWPPGESFWRWERANHTNSNCRPGARWVVLPRFSKKAASAEVFDHTDRSLRSRGYVPVRVSKGTLFFEGQEKDPADFVVYELKPLNELRELAEQNPGQYAPALATALDNQASVDRQQNRLAEACQHYEEALKIQRQLAAQNPTLYLPDMALTLGNLGPIEVTQNRIDDARQHLEEALKIYQQLVQQKPAAYLPNLAMALTHVGELDRQQNRLDEARLLFQAALRTYRQAADQNSSVLADMVTPLNDLGDLYLHQNRIGDAIQCYEEQLRVYRALARQEPDKYLPDVARTLSYLEFLNRALQRAESPAHTSPKH